MAWKFGTKFFFFFFFGGGGLNFGPGIFFGFCLKP